MGTESLASAARARPEAEGVVTIRLSRTSHGNYSLGIGVSRWPLPKPRGMKLYVLHLIFWNLVWERKQ